MGMSHESRDLCLHPLGVDGWVCSLCVVGVWFGTGHVCLLMVGSQATGSAYPETLAALVSYEALMKRRSRQLLRVVFMLCVLGVATACVLYALRQNINLFYSPSQIVAGEASPDRIIRVGGMVVPGSVVHHSDDLSVRFQVTDYQQSINILYRGSLPDLFREGQGIVAQGTLMNDRTLRATTVLAKHDESYMPPEVRYALQQAKKQGDT